MRNASHHISTYQSVTTEQRSARPPLFIWPHRPFAGLRGRRGKRSRDIYIGQYPIVVEVLSHKDSSGNRRPR